MVAGPPIVFYVYYNVVHHYGLEEFCSRCGSGGVDAACSRWIYRRGEAKAYEAVMKHGELRPIYLVAPTTPSARVGKISRHASGFIYYVSREGVTGMQKKLAPSAMKHIEIIRKHSKLPVAIGFGISNPAQARAAAQAADAVVVGSAIVNQIAKHGTDRQFAAKVGRFVGAMVRAVKKEGK